MNLIEKVKHKETKTDVMRLRHHLHSLNITTTNSHQQDITVIKIKLLATIIINILTLVIQKCHLVDWAINTIESSPRIGDCAVMNHISTINIRNKQASKVTTQENATVEHQAFQMKAALFLHTRT